MIEVKVVDTAFRNELALLYRRMGDLTPVMQDIGSMMESRISDRFESRTDPTGKRWAPWAPSTVDSYPEDGNHQLLDRYGDMLLSRNSQADKNSVKIGFSQPYATYHEYGTKHMPRRGLLFADPDAGTLGSEDEVAVLDIIENWLTR